MRGWETYGVDTSEKACRLAAKTLGEKVCNCALIDCSFPDRYFDVVLLNHVIEHMSCPNEERVEIGRILKDNGVVFIYTPNIASYQFKATGDEWLHLDVPRHLILYSPARALRGELCALIQDLIKRNLLNSVQKPLR